MNNATYKTVHEKQGEAVVGEGFQFFPSTNGIIEITSGCHYNEQTGEVSDLDPNHRDWSDDEIGPLLEEYVLYGDMEIAICDRCGRFVLDEDDLCTGECFVDAEDRRHTPAPYHL